MKPTLFPHKRILAILLLSFAALRSPQPLFAESGAEKTPFKHTETVLGSIGVADQKLETPQGTMTVRARDVDSVGFESPDGCRVALATTIDPSKAQLFVQIDGTRVKGFDDVVWHTVMFSPDGKRYAFVANENGGQVCVVDGVPGPLFDQVCDQTCRPGFSSDSKHIAYTARKDGRSFAVVDGKIGPAFDFVQSSMMNFLGRGFADGQPALVRTAFAGSPSIPAFFPDGQHVVYLGVHGKAGGQTYSIVVDERVVADTGLFYGFNFSPDGHHVAYATNLNGKNSVAYDDHVEGALGPVAHVADFVWSYDGSRRGYIIVSPGRPGSAAAVIDGHLQKLYESVTDLAFSQDGSHYSYRTYNGATGFGGVILDGAELANVDGYRPNYVLFRDGGKRALAVVEKGEDKAIAEDGKVIATFPHAWLLHVSPDGRHFAWSVSRGGPKTQMYRDGTPDPVIMDIDTSSWAFIGFSADSQHFAYVERNSPRDVQVVIDGVVGPSCEFVARNQPILSGRHFAYAARFGAATRVCLDGAFGPSFKRVDDDTIRFTPDGETLVYIATLDNDESVVVVNNKPGPPAQGVVPESITFSPKGGRLGYSVIEGARRTLVPSINPFPMSQRPSYRVIIDGVLGASLSWQPVKKILFSSDGRHYSYIDEQKELVASVVVDGRSGPEFASIAAGPVVRTDGSLEYMAVEGRSEGRRLVRVTVAGFGPRSTQGTKDSASASPP